MFSLCGAVTVRFLERVGYEAKLWRNSWFIAGSARAFQSLLHRVSISAQVHLKITLHAVSAKGFFLSWCRWHTAIWRCELLDVLQHAELNLALLSTAGNFRHLPAIASQGPTLFQLTYLYTISLRELTDGREVKWKTCAFDHRFSLSADCGILQRKKENEAVRLRKMRMRSISLCCKLTGIRLQVRDD